MQIGFLENFHDNSLEHVTQKPPSIPYGRAVDLQKEGFPLSVNVPVIPMHLESWYKTSDRPLFEYFLDGARIIIKPGSPVMHY